MKHTLEAAGADKGMTMGDLRHAILYFADAPDEALVLATIGLTSRLRKLLVKWDDQAETRAEVPPGAVVYAPAEAGAQVHDQVLDPDCKAGKCGSCAGPPCEHECHGAQECRHCGTLITWCAAGWADGHGFLACVKAPPGGTPVLHQPMPSALRP